MNQAEAKAFVYWCYETIFGRRPGERETRSSVDSLMQGMPKLDLLVQFIESDEAKVLRTANKFVPPGHYHSPLPSAEDIEAHLRRGPSGLEGVRIDEAAQLATLETLSTYYELLPFGAKKTPDLRYYYENSMYSYADAIFLATMLLLNRPSRVIEVGSGFSSCVLLDVNELFLENAMDLSFIEPFPDRLMSLLDGSLTPGVRLLTTPLQDIALSEFRELRSGDVLFIDSTHVAKVGSDVNYLVFDILPTLSPGVLVHFHDVFYPFEYPTDWLLAGRAWNEQYVLHAFLQFSDAYEIVLFGHRMVSAYPDWFRRNMPLCLNNPGGSLWLRRVSTPEDAGAS